MRRRMRRLRSLSAEMRWWRVHRISSHYKLSSYTRIDPWTILVCTSSHLAQEDLSTSASALASPTPFSLCIFVQCEIHFELDGIMKIINCRRCTSGGSRFTRISQLRVPLVLLLIFFLSMGEFWMFLVQMWAWRFPQTYSSRNREADGVMKSKRVRITNPESTWLRTSGLVYSSTSQRGTHETQVKNRWGEQTMSLY